MSSQHHLDVSFLLGKLPRRHCRFWGLCTEKRGGSPCKIAAFALKPAAEGDAGLVMGLL